MENKNSNTNEINNEILEDGGIFAHADMRVISSVPADEYVGEPDWEQLGKIALVGTAVAGLGYFLLNAFSND